MHIAFARFTLKEETKFLQKLLSIFTPKQGYVCLPLHPMYVNMCDL